MHFLHIKSVRSLSAIWNSLFLAQLTPASFDYVARLCRRLSAIFPLIKLFLILLLRHSNLEKIRGLIDEKQRRSIIVHLSCLFFSSMWMTRWLHSSHTFHYDCTRGKYSIFIALCGIELPRTAEGIPKQKWNEKIISLLRYLIELDVKQCGIWLTSRIQLTADITGLRAPKILRQPLSKNLIRHSFAFQLDVSSTSLSI